MSDTDDELVSEYLRRLETVAAGMPADRRRELIDEITAHIAEARATLPADPGDPADPAGIRTVLDQLGSPEDIVRAAGATPAFADPEPELVEATASGALAPPGTLEIVAVIALLIGGLIVPVIGWVIGVVLLWVSNSWRTRDKLLGTLVWPGGLLAALVVFVGVGAAAIVPVCSGGAITASPGSVRTVIPSTCSGSGIPPWLAITIAAVLVLASIVGPIAVAIRLLRQARRPLPATAESARTWGALVSS